MVRKWLELGVSKLLQATFWSWWGLTKEKGLNWMMTLGHFNFKSFILASNWWFMHVRKKNVILYALHIHWVPAVQCCRCTKASSRQPSATAVAVVRSAAPIYPRAIPINPIKNVIFYVLCLLWFFLPFCWLVFSWYENYRRNNVNKEDKRLMERHAGLLRRCVQWRIL